MYVMIVARKLDMTVGPPKHFLFVPKMSLAMLSKQALLSRLKTLGWLGTIAGTSVFTYLVILPLPS